MLGADQLGELTPVGVEQLAEREHHGQSSSARENERQPGKALAAEATASSTTAAEAKSTVPVTSPVAGL